MANVSVNVNLSGIKHKLGNGNMWRAKHAMANQMLLDMNRLVPRRKGTLRASGHVTSQANVEYSAIHARSQFYGIVTARNGTRHSVKRYTTPGTGKRWDLKAKVLYSNKWSGVFVKGLGLKK